MVNLCNSALVPENGRRSIGRFLAPLLELPHVQANFLGPFQIEGLPYSLPRFAFQGPNSSDPIRIGLFAAIHGDEPAGALAVREFLTRLVTEPALAENFHLDAYPLCNPPGFEDNSRHSRRGRDLNREFWRGSTEAEVQLMDLENYETFSLPLEADLKGQLTPGGEVQYLDAMGKRRITRA